MTPPPAAAPKVPKPLPTVVEAELAKYQSTLDALHAGAIDPDKVFKPFRLVQGVYGQRQGGENQMIRIKLKYGLVTSPPVRQSSFTTSRWIAPQRCCVIWKTSA
jgi:hypothetical protein